MQVILSKQLDADGTLTGYNLRGVFLPGSGGEHGVREREAGARDQAALDAAFAAVLKHLSCFPEARPATPNHSAKKADMCLNWAMHISVCNELLARPAKVLDTLKGMLDVWSKDASARCARCAFDAQ